MKTTLKKIVSVIASMAAVAAISVSSVSAAVNTIDAKAHVQDKGTLSSTFHAGDVIGTTGESRRLEKVWLKLNPTPFYSQKSSIGISTHQANRDWVGYNDAPCGSWAVSGTEGQSRAIEAVRIRLHGDIERKCDVIYRAHVADLGWLPAVANGMVAGTTHQGRRAEAIQVIIVPKNTGMYVPGREGYGRLNGFQGFRDNGGYYGNDGFFDNRR